uniref:hypothetical protein n=1 Tax=Parerythrobacter lutipelagi TaxID=1964208 RepID=UPI001F01E489|nr:hypothetical protein [Parerythrobacter lutipelagi]
MPELTRAVFRPALAKANVPQRPTDIVSFADLVRMMAEGVADAQLALDRTSAEMTKELAETTVEIVPQVTEVIDRDGNVTYKQGKAREVSLLELGVEPTFYQFSSATVEATMDLHIVESVDSTTKEKRRVGLFAGTQDIKTDRAFNRDMRSTSKLTATMVPVPRPVRIGPLRTTENEGG